MAVLHNTHAHSHTSSYLNRCPHILYLKIPSVCIPFSLSTVSARTVITQGKGPAWPFSSCASYTSSRIPPNMDGLKRASWGVRRGGEGRGGVGRGGEGRDRVGKGRERKGRGRDGEGEEREGEERGGKGREGWGRRGDEWREDGRSGKGEHEGRVFFLPIQQLTPCNSNLHPQHTNSHPPQHCYLRCSHFFHCWFLNPLPATCEGHTLHTAVTVLGKHMHRNLYETI